MNFEYKGKTDKTPDKLSERPYFLELETLLGLLTYHRTEKGRTSGSRVMFVSEHHCPILLHKPHGRKELLEYQVK